MTTAQTNEPLTEAEAQDFAVKTQAWWNGLTPKEQARVRQFHQAAAHPTGDDVQGYSGPLDISLGTLLFGDFYPILSALLTPQPTTTTSPTGGTTGGSSGGTTSRPRLLN